MPQSSLNPLSVIKPLRTHWEPSDLYLIGVIPSLRTSVNTWSKQVWCDVE